MQTRPPLRHPQLEDDMYAARWSIIAQRNSLVVVVKTEKYAIIINLGIKLQLYSVPVSNTNKLSSSLASLFSNLESPFQKVLGPFLTLRNTQLSFGNNMVTLRPSAKKGAIYNMFP